MASSDATSMKKKELLAYKAKILQEIKYYDKRIEEVRSKCLKTSFVEDSDRLVNNFGLIFNAENSFVS